MLLLNLQSLCILVVASTQDFYIFTFCNGSVGCGDYFLLSTFSIPTTLKSIIQKYDETQLYSVFNISDH